MRARLLLAILVAVGLVPAVQARQQSSSAPQEPQIIRLWPDRAPGALGDQDEDTPTLAIYLPPGAANTTEPIAAVIIAPGGGYRTLAMAKEGRAPNGPLRVAELNRVVVAGSEPILQHERRHPGRPLTRSIGSAASACPESKCVDAVDARCPPAENPKMPMRSGAMRHSLARVLTRPSEFRYSAGPGRMADAAGELAAGQWLSEGRAPWPAAAGSGDSRLDDPIGQRSGCARGPTRPAQR